MQYRTAQRIRYWTLTITVLATIATIILLTLSMGESQINVPVYLYIVAASTGAASSVGCMGATCTLCILQRLDEHAAAFNDRTDKRVTNLANNLAEIRLSLSEFAASVAEYGDQRATTGRLEAMQHLTNPPTPADADRIVTHIGRQATR